MARCAILQIRKRTKFDVIIAEYNSACSTFFHPKKRGLNLKSLQGGSCHHGRNFRSSINKTLRLLDIRNTDQIPISAAEVKGLPSQVRNERDGAWVGLSGSRGTWPDLEQGIKRTKPFRKMSSLICTREVSPLCKNRTLQQ